MFPISDYTSAQPMEKRELRFEPRRNYTSSPSVMQITARLQEPNFLNCHSKLAAFAQFRVVGPMLMNLFNRWYFTVVLPLAMTAEGLMSK